MQKNSCKKKEKKAINATLSNFNRVSAVVIFIIYLNFIEIEAYLRELCSRTHKQP